MCFQLYDVCLNAVKIQPQMIFRTQPRGEESENSITLILFSILVFKQCYTCRLNIRMVYSFPVAQMVEHDASNAKIMGSIPRESKS